MLGSQLRLNGHKCKTKRWGDGYALTLLVTCGFASTNRCSCAALCPNL
jgi:hypothetical protein